VTVSKNTAREVLDIVEQYVPSAQLGQLLQELAKVKGNRSYADTIALLRNEHEKTK